MTQAFPLWRTYPTEIAHDLSRYHSGRHIREWHRGEMSSRELLELIEFLPDRSAYKTARRAGDWSPEEYRQADLINSVACQLESYQPVLSPMQEHIANAVDRFRVDRHADNLAQLRGERRVS